MRRKAPRNVLVAMLAALALAALAVPASAGTIVSDNIVQLPLPGGCVAQGGAGGCTPGSVTGADAVAASPDSRTAYVATPGAVVSLARGNGGSLAQIDSDGGFSAASDVVVSPDGQNVYVADAGAGSVSAFARGSDGTLAPLGSLAGLPGASSIAISPDGRTVYAGTANGVAALARQSDGTLVSIGTSGPGSVAGLAVSPDGADVYAISLATGQVAVLARGSDGSLTPSGAAGAVATRAGIAVSSDGRNVYTTEVASSTVTTFARSADGSLTALASLATLAGPQGIAVSSDGANVYVASSGADGIVAFVRGTAGVVSQVNCVTEAGAGACATGTALAGATGVAVGPEGLNVYVASTDSSVAVFARLRRVSIDIPAFCDPMYEICGPIPVEPVEPPPLAPPTTPSNGPAVGHNRMPDLLPIWLRASCEGDGSVQARVRVHVTRPGLVNLARVRFTIPGRSKGAKVVTVPVRDRTRLTVRVTFSTLDLRGPSCGRRIVARLDPGDRLTERRERNNTISARIRGHA